VDWWEALAGTVVALICLYAALLAGLWVYARRNSETVGMRDALRLLPDVSRLVHRLAVDPAVARGVRLRAGLLIVYLLLPFDLVPDFLPVIGYADDVLVLALVLRSVVRSAGADALRRNWPGSDAGLAVVQRLAGIGAADRT